MMARSGSADPDHTDFGPEAKPGAEPKAHTRVLSALEEIHALISGIATVVPPLSGLRFGLARLQGHLAALRALE